MFPRTHPHSLASQSSTMLTDWTMYISSISAPIRNLEVSTESPRIVHDTHSSTVQLAAMLDEPLSFIYSYVVLCGFESASLSVLAINHVVENRGLSIYSNCLPGMQKNDAGNPNETDMNVLKLFASNTTLTCNPHR
ncbi:d77d11bd-722a-4cba-9254-6d91f0047e5b-CDS [Sclerotinia trifoliorum]|uniref:D77d11bd-722a-4cba-9254-6d91f0047e5b-CDS n=1 Tax=Sclerotinia trifoliorum TaxID=28548 RepID=A0A8H2ZNU1_9HELO|nr:d77d11bd-722a-4cba-9254-6d91f0047e5b-CDS [Sclerotinia trifoliorum]